MEARRPAEGWSYSEHEEFFCLSGLQLWMCGGWFVAHLTLSVGCQLCFFPWGHQDHSVWGGAGRAALGGQAISRCISHLHCITDYHSLAAGNYAHWPAHSSVGLKSGQGMAEF